MPAPRNRSWLLFLLGGLIAGLASAFCFMGAVMNGSFAVAGVDRFQARSYRHAADHWSAGTLALFFISVGLLIGAWRRKRSR